MTELAAPAAPGRTRPDPKTLDAIFRPSSVAVIGASTRRGSIGREILHNLIVGDFQGKLFPVNPKAEYIHSIKSYPSILDVPDPVDLAIIVVPYSAAENVVKECGQKGVKGLIVITAGYREIGPEGAERERRLVEIAHSAGMRLVGPNCLGVFNADPEVSLNATFAPGTPLPGRVGFVSQSGALGIAIWTEMQKLNVGFSQFVSIGNRADVSSNDLLEYWENDAQTNLMALYIENLGDAKRFTTLARRITKHKPIVMVKSGRTEAGARAASSHTGALSAMDLAIDALFRQTGVIRAAKIDDMMALILGFSRCPLPAGDRVVVLSNAGGPGILATDALVAQGLKLAEISAKTKKALSAKLPEEASVANPIDMIAGADAKSFRECLEILLAAPEIDLAIVAFVPPVMVDPMEVVQAVTEARKKSRKPVYMVLMAEEEYYRRIPVEMPESPPIYRYPEVAAYTASEMVRYVRWRERESGAFPDLERDTEEARAILENAPPGEYLDPDAAFRLLEAYRFPIARWKRARTSQEAIEAAESLGYPVAVKIASRKIVHKSDIGGVVLGIRNTLEMEGAISQLGRALRRHGIDPEREGFLVQEMVTDGRETILGMNRDPLLGPVLLFGLGGKYVEILKDVSLRIYPITDLDAREMIESIRGFPLLQGVRGEGPVALPVAEEGLLRLSALAGDLLSIVEIDLNPFVLGERVEDCKVLDARIRKARASN